jgi:hypothetical protein
MSELTKGFQIGCGIAAAVFGIPMLLCGGCLITAHTMAHRPASPTAKATEPQSSQPTAAKQKQRAELLAKLTAQGAFYKIEDRGGGLVRVYTGPAFDALAIDTKRAFVSVVYAYYFEGKPSGGTVILHDGRSGKKIGTFDRYGLTIH